MANNMINTNTLFGFDDNPIPSLESAPTTTPVEENVDPLYSYVNNTEAWKKKYLHPNVLTGEWELITDDYGDEIHHWKMFTPGFCKAVIDEAERQNKWTTDRHQYYPTHDVPLKDLGLYEIYDSVLREYGFPIASKLWRLEGKSWDKHMTHETFIIKYTPSSDNQTHLNIHHDQADYTIHITLSDNFTGGGTWFPRQNKLVKGSVGSSVLFPNVTHPHGTRPTLSGERYCLISFCSRGPN